MQIYNDKNPVTICNIPGMISFILSISKLSPMHLTTKNPHPTKVCNKKNKFVCMLPIHNGKVNAAHEP